VGSRCGLGFSREEKSVGIGEHNGEFQGSFPARPGTGARGTRREAAADNAAEPTDAAAFEEALRQRDDDLAEAKQLLAEMTDYAEKVEARVIELIAMSEPMAKALLLPGVKSYLLQRFHPDKYPDADDNQRALLTSALKTINAAYAKASELRMPDDGEATPGA
jgi:hypothetical protein